MNDPTTTWTHDRLKPKDWKGEPCVAIQPKRDGHRVTLFVQCDGAVFAYGREIKPELDLWDKYQRFRDVIAPIITEVAPRTSIDGELYVPGGRASDVKTALAGGDLPLRFDAFAVPWCNGVDQREDDPLAIHARFKDIIPFVETRPFEGGTYAGLAEQAAHLGLEGWVLKQKNYSGWFKVKHTKTVDAYVVGTKDGNGKHLGLLGALIVAVGKGRVIANVSGMTDAERVMLSDLEMDGKLEGRVVEVEYQAIGSKGKLQHPRFVRMRDDKVAAECTEDQVCS